MFLVSDDFKFLNAKKPLKMSKIISKANLNPKKPLKNPYNIKSRKTKKIPSKKVLKTQKIVKCDEIFQKSDEIPLKKPKNKVEVIASLLKFLETLYLICFSSFSCSQLSASRSQSILCSFF